MTSLDSLDVNGLENIDDSKYTGLATEEYTRENPLGGLHVHVDETSSSIASLLHAHSVALKTAISNAKDLDDLKAAFQSIPESELKETVNYIGSPIVDFLHANLVGIYDEQYTSNSIHVLMTRACEQTDNVHLIKFLIARGANLHTYSDAALLSACSGGNIKIVKFLLASGTININKNMGHIFVQAVDFAIDFDHIHIVKLLITPMSSRKTAHNAMLHAAKKG